jgi:hypothetical protein
VKTVLRRGLGVEALLRPEGVLLRGLLRPLTGHLPGVLSGYPKGSSERLGRVKAPGVPRGNAP